MASYSHHYALAAVSSGDIDERIRTFESNIERFQVLAGILSCISEHSDPDTIRLVEDTFDDELRNIRDWIEEDFQRNGPLPTSVLEKWVALLEQSA